MSRRRSSVDRRRPNALRGAADATCRLPVRILLTIALMTRPGG